jgi:hypothetical protein
VTYGPRFNGGYQFPATDAASLTRQDPIRREGPIGGQDVRLLLIPLTGGRQRVVYDLCGSWVRTRHPLWTETFSILIDDEHRAKDAFGELATQLRAGGRMPDLIDPRG